VEAVSTITAIISPGRTVWAGLDDPPFTLTLPPLIAAEARGRVLNARTDQSHRSKRMLGNLSVKATTAPIKSGEGKHHVSAAAPEA
jgi:hypothetical protein